MIRYRRLNEFISSHSLHWNPGEGVENLWKAHEIIWRDGSYKLEVTFWYILDPETELDEANLCVDLHSKMDKEHKATKVNFYSEEADKDLAQKIWSFICSLDWDNLSDLTDSTLDLAEKIEQKFGGDVKELPGWNYHLRAKDEKIYKR